METKKRKISKDTLKKVGIGVAIGTGVGLLIGGVVAIVAANSKYNSGAWSDFTMSGGPKVYNNDVINHVKAHSTLKDRLNTGKMVDMAFASFDILNGSLEGPKGGDNWKYKFTKENGVDMFSIKMGNPDYKQGSCTRNNNLYPPEE